MQSYQYNWKVVHYFNGDSLATFTAISKAHFSLITRGYVMDKLWIMNAEIFWGVFFNHIPFDYILLINFTIPCMIKYKLHLHLQYEKDSVTMQHLSLASLFLCF